MKLILTTFASADDAARVIRTLVEEHLIACGTILPQARSIYAWQGRIEDTEEAMVFLKTSDECLTTLQSRLAEVHPYETPEIIVIAPNAVNPPYAEWIQDMTA